MFFTASLTLAFCIWDCWNNFYVAYNIMMKYLISIFGQNKDINTIQMCDRGIVLFVIALVLIRISGRRSFGMRTPLDNIIVVMLGAVLSRAVVGASPFLPVVAVCFVTVLFHRFLGWLIAKSKRFARIVEGDKFLLFKDGQYIKDNMEKALVCEEDLMQGVRKSALTEDMEKIKTVYMERNGDISAVKKE
jgi:uncharacterized membrane protein YcaP (DUF421 family)